MLKKRYGKIFHGQKEGTVFEPDEDDMQQPTVMIQPSLIEDREHPSDEHKREGNHSDKEVISIHKEEPQSVTEKKEEPPYRITGLVIFYEDPFLSGTTPDYGFEDELDGSDGPITDIPEHILISLWEFINREE